MSQTVSIIVPIFNAEHYLFDCLESISKQSYKDLEILLVNDGSTDKSLSIAESFAMNDKRFKVFDKQNGGQASARNLALDNASGDFICFVDADDTISLDMIEKNISVLISDDTIDVVQFPIYMDYGLDTANIKKFKPTSIQSKYQLFKEWLMNNEISWLVCNKMFRKSIFKNLRFPEDMIYEDNYIIVDILDSIDHLYINNEGIYYYHSRKDSTTTSKLTLKKEIDTQKVSMHILQKIKSNVNLQNERILILSRILNVYQSIYSNFKPSLEIDSSFLEEFKKLSFLKIMKSNIEIKQKVKLLLSRIIGVTRFLEFYK